MPTAVFIIIMEGTVQQVAFHNTIGIILYESDQQFQLICGAIDTRHG